MKERQQYVRYKFDISKLKTLYGTRGTIIEFEDEDDTIMISGNETMYKVNEDGTITQLVNDPYTNHIYITEVIDSLDLTDETHFRFATYRLIEELKENLSYARYDIGDEIAFTDWYELFTTNVDDIEDKGTVKLSLVDIAYQLLHNVIKITETYYE